MYRVCAYSELAKKTEYVNLYGNPHASFYRKSLLHGLPFKHSCYLK